MFNSCLTLNIPSVRFSFNVRTLFSLQLLFVDSWFRGMLTRLNVFKRLHICHSHVQGYVCDIPPLEQIEPLLFHHIHVTSNRPEKQSNTVTEKSMVTVRLSEPRML